MARSSKQSMSGKSDCVIIGAGPAGLALAIALGRMGKRVSVLERQDLASLSNPQFDGRDIAITHGSRKILADLGIWQNIPAKEISPAKGARVLDGTSPFSLTFDHSSVDKDVLGHFVSNHNIRQSAYAIACKTKGVTLHGGVEIKKIEDCTGGKTVFAADGSQFTGDLVIAADGRFSSARRMLGIATEMRDFGKSVIVARLRHEKPHHGIAYEWFHYGRTLAVLPLAGNMSSVVITLPAGENAAVMAQKPADFAQDVMKAFDHKLGKMELVTERFSYPLVAVHAASFIADRFALLGDAAVGMHPVTAHGYNLGLRCVDVLREEIARATSLGLTCGDVSVLQAYNRRARFSTWPLYKGTNFLVGLYNDTRPAAKLARKALLRIGQGVPTLKNLVTNYLAE